MRPPLLILLPIALVALGVVLLIGCIPIPATHQLQPNGKARPEWAVGAKPDKPVRLGHTRIEQAMIELTRRVAGPQPPGGLLPVATIDPASAGAIHRWRVSPDARQFSMEYTIRTATWVVPLCFTAVPQSGQRWLTLEVDERGVVTGSRTTEQPPVLDPTPPQRWLEVLDADQRRVLREAGLFPADDVLRQAGQVDRN